MESVESVTDGPPIPKNNNNITLPTPAEGCGSREVEHRRIDGIAPAALNSWPWMALIGYKNTFGEVSFECGGSVISRRHVLTAAHCIHKDLSLARIGEHDTSTDAETNHIDIPVVKDMYRCNTKSHNCILFMTILAFYQ
ncbi:serine protease easter-like isoform X2 [Wyeomyia smithii]|uniref:serine protease easter-like isoform X2 n=1 Tax=Wyeomyia smithii TaxID=174621 RepID=UPI002467D75A|nr:serine protease easter-like isoform X2 [Wyeomyia smithii]